MQLHFDCPNAHEDEATARHNVEVRLLVVRSKDGKGAAAPSSPSCSWENATTDRAVVATQWFA